MLSINKGTNNANLGMGGWTFIPLFSKISLVLLHMQHFLSVTW